MNAADIMTREVVTVTPDTAVAEIARLMLERRVSAVPVVQDGAPIGIVSEGDLLRRADSGTEPRTSRWLEAFPVRDSLAAEYVRTHGRVAREVMTSEVISVAETTSVADIAGLLESRHIKRVPVVAEDGRLVGIVSRANLLQSLASRAAPPSAVTVDDQRIRAALLDELGTPGLVRAAGPGQRDRRGWRGASVGPGALARGSPRDGAGGAHVAGVKSVEDHMDRDRDHDAMTWPNWPAPARP